MTDKKRIKWTTTKIITVGYLLVIITGTLLLMLPAANREHAWFAWDSVINALFTATSATCVTGLVLHDTYTFWSEFGQGVILVLIQIGGIGFMTVAISAMVLAGKKIHLSKRLLMQEAVAAPQIGGIVRMSKFVILGTFLIEGIGAVLLAIYFVPRLGIGKGIYFSVFHSISAFCNAGIDLMGYYEPSSSLVTASSSVIVSVTIMLLIIIGGLGFFVWADLKKNKYHFRSYRLHSKIVLTMTLLLIAGGAVLIFLFEWGKPSMEGKSIGEQILCSLFQSVTPRTAGFNSMDLTAMTDSSRMLMTIFMFIGGSPGSTAGGVKTTTIALMFLCIWAEFRKRKDIECFKRRIEGDTLRHASCVLMLYAILIGASSMFISAIEETAILDVLFEVTSAIGTVGLSLGLTPQLGTLSHIILILLMFIGRVGGITILIAFSNWTGTIPSKLPIEKITIG
ncbi:Trk family potassium uptake protein [Blautia sp. An249]|uniref:TrkH family potassium uptake protein n=1 Tax=Blautia sp. An249 TaxID=1965603 RepID=UPI000B3A8F71|nr:potassium transporter TrkG [Blautia sp. An249]OUO76620.1 Trk family potassium uptake protein [Blautia sp. An249]